MSVTDLRQSVCMGDTYRVGGRRLGAAGLSGDDDLVNGQDCPGGLGGKLDRPALGDQEIQNAVITGVQGAGAILVLATC